MVPLTHLPKHGESHPVKSKSSFGALHLKFPAILRNFARKVVNLSMPGEGSPHPVPPCPGGSFRLPLTFTQKPVGGTGKRESHLLLCVLPLLPLGGL